jgi:hypothetical protein
LEWYKPRKAVREIQDKSNALAIIAILALGLSMVALFIAIGRDVNAED